MNKNKQSIKEIILFIIYTFSISWFCWLIIIIANRVFETLWYGELLTWIPMLMGALGPAIGAYIIYKQHYENNSFKSFLKLIFGQKISKKAWIIFGLYTIWRFVMVWFAFGIQDPISIIYMFINLPLFIIGGGFEEIGWRAYLQPKLEKVTNQFLSILIVGLIWSLWHLPLWMISGTVQSALPFAMYTIMAMILSVSFTIFYKHTKNIFLIVFTHAWFNACIGLVVYIGSDGFLKLDLSWKVYLVFIIELAIAIFIGMKYKIKNSEFDNIFFN